MITARCRQPRGQDVRADDGEAGATADRSARVLDNVPKSVAPAFIVTALVSGKAGVRDLTRRSFRWLVPLRWYLTSLLAPLLILLIAVMIRYGFPVLRALGQNWLLLFTAFLPALAIMILLNNVAEGDRMDRIRLRPIPRSSWPAPRPADDSVLLTVPRSELLCRHAIMGDDGAGAGHPPAPASGQPIDHWLARQRPRLQRVDHWIVPFHAQRHREPHRPSGRGRSATVRSVADHGRVPGPPRAHDGGASLARARRVPLEPAGPAGPRHVYDRRPKNE